MSTYTQFGYTYAAPTSQLLVGQGSAPAGSNGCCEGTRALMTDPVSGQTVCSCQYDRLAIGSYSRLGSGLGATGGVYGTTYTSSEQNPYPSIGVDSSAFYTPFGSSYGMKEGSSGDVSMYGTGLGASPAGYYPYDATFAAYGYGPGYDLAARRKNATRESTATLKAWLNEHKKNPYPTKGEKIMLAIITKMTLTQVSTWFANARRRLKKENKMTWEPRNKTDDDDAKLSDDDDEEKEPGDKDDDDIKKDDKDDSSMAETKVEDGDGQTQLKSCEGGAAPKAITAALSPAPALHHGSPFAVSKGEKMSILDPQSDCAVSLQSSKPKIWSLADTAACKTPPPAGSIPGVVGGGWLAGGTTFPLPPTIPPSQSQYSRFSQLMSGVSTAQYMSGYSESVGTDTPPQTPPNSNKSSSGGFHNNGNGGYGPNIGSCNQNLSSCSRTSSNQGLSTANDSPMLQRYSSAAPLPTNQGGTNSAGTMQNTAFSPVYKNSQQNSQQNANQQAPSSAVAAAAAAMVSQHQQQQQQQQQQLQCQQNQQTQRVATSYVS